MIALRGITWDHGRGYLPMEATAKAYMAAHPGIHIAWEKRSLKQFEEIPIEKLAPDFDLIVIDHPFVGVAAARGIVAPLDGLVPEAFLADQAANSVGPSHASYRYRGHQWALAIDAAAPVAFWAEGATERLGGKPPDTWDDALAVGREGLMEIPAAPINCLMNFYMLCLAVGATPFADTAQVAPAGAGREALHHLREILQLCDPGCWERNPIASHERLAGGRSRAVYCPFSYGYSNYAMRGRAPKRLHFGEPPAFRGQPLRSTLGGTGLAVSALRNQRAEAAAYAQYVASPEVQRGIYTHAGGQPGHRTAWLDQENNRLTDDYFARTLPVLDRAFLRPRYCGHLEFQEQGGPIVHAALRSNGANDAAALAELDRLYRHSLTLDHPA